MPSPWPSEPPAVSLPGGAGALSVHDARPARAPLPVAARAPRYLHARRVRRHPGHREPAVVPAIGLDFVFGQNTGFDKRRVERDGIMADGQKEAVPPLPFRLVRP